jgi:hypothetical protein
MITGKREYLVQYKTHYISLAHVLQEFAFERLQRF